MQTEEVIERLRSGARLPQPTAGQVSVAWSRFASGIDAVKRGQQGNGNGCSGRAGSSAG